MGDSLNSENLQALAADAAVSGEDHTWFLALHGLFSALAIVLNMVCVYVVRMRFAMETISVFVITLAVVDLMQAIAIIPAEIYFLKKIQMRYTPSMLIENSMVGACRIYDFLMTWCDGMTTLILVVVAADRLMRMTLAEEAFFQLSVRTSWIVICTSGVLTALVATMQAVEAKYLHIEVEGAEVTIKAVTVPGTIQTCALTEVSGPLEAASRPKYIYPFRMYCRLALLCLVLFMYIVIAVLEVLPFCRTTTTIGVVEEKPDETPTSRLIASRVFEEALAAKVPANPTDSVLDLSPRPAIKAPNANASAKVATVPAVRNTSESTESTEDTDESSTTETPSVATGSEEAIKEEESTHSQKTASSRTKGPKHVQTFRSDHDELQVPQIDFPYRYSNSSNILSVDPQLLTIDNEKLMIAVEAAVTKFTKDQPEVAPHSMAACDKLLKRVLQYYFRKDCLLLEREKFQKAAVHPGPRGASTSVDSKGGGSQTEMAKHELLLGAAKENIFRRARVAIKTGQHIVMQDSVDYENRLSAMRHSLSSNRDSFVTTNISVRVSRRTIFMMFCVSVDFFLASLPAALFFLIWNDQILNNDAAPHRGNIFVGSVRSLASEVISRYGVYDLLRLHVVFVKPIFYFAVNPIFRRNWPGVPSLRRFWKREHPPPIVTINDE